MSILGLIKSIFAPAAQLVDALHTSEEERLTAKAQMLNTYAQAIEIGLEHESRALEAKAKIISAEASSAHKLAAVWRPVTMLCFVAVIMYNYVLAPTVGAFGVEVPTVEIADKMWTLLTVGIGGYIGSRGVEKVAPAVVQALKAKDET